MDNLPLVLRHAQNGLGQGRLAAPRFPHQPQDLSPADGHIDVLEHLDGPPSGKGTAALAVKTVELANLQNGFHGLTPVSVWWEWPR